MKINSMKLLIIMTQLVMVSGVITALFMLEIPAGNREVAYVILGALVTDTIHSINNMFQRRGTNE